MTDTDELIERLVADLAPVRAMPHPASRLARWLLLSLGAAGTVAWLMGLRPDLVVRLSDPAFLAGQAASLLTAVMAGYAAFCAGLPDEPGWKLWTPWAAFGLWLATLGRQCWEAWVTMGSAGLILRQDAMCIPAVAAGALVPAVAVVAMLRGATCVRAGRAALLGALAAAAVGDFALRLYHMEDAALTVIVWQLGSVALFSVVGGAVIRRLLGTQATHPPALARP